MSDFFERKMRNLFKRLDFDSSNSISKEDFETLSNNLILLGYLDEDKADVLRKSILNLWMVLVPTDVHGNNGSIGFNDFYLHVKETLADDRKRLVLQDTVTLIFDAIDVDKSGEISKDEFSNYFKSINIHDNQVAYDVFTAMDTSGDSVISKEEFQEFARDFFFCEDESNPAKLFFGPLD